MTISEAIAEFFVLIWNFVMKILGYDEAIQEDEATTAAPETV